MSTFKKAILDLVIEIFNLRQRQMPKTYDKIKVELVIVEQTLAFNSSTNLLEKLRMYIQISNELHGGTLCYR